MDYRAIGQRIRRLRKAQNLSQEELAEKIWISTTHMSHIETGSTKLSLPVLVDIAHALNASTDELLAESRAATASLAAEAAAIIGSCNADEASLLIAIMKDVKAHLDRRREETAQEK